MSVAMFKQRSNIHIITSFDPLLAKCGRMHLGLYPSVHVCIENVNSTDKYHELKLLNKFQSFSHY